MVKTQESPPRVTRAARNKNIINKDDDDPTRSPSRGLKAATSMPATVNTFANNNNNAALLPNATTASNDANHKNNTALLVPDATTASDGVDIGCNTTLRPYDLVERENDSTGSTIATLTYDVVTKSSGITQSAENSKAPIGEQNLYSNDININVDTPMVCISSKRCIHYSDDEY